jgi:hypothetical protein
MVNNECVKLLHKTQAKFTEIICTSNVRRAILGSKGCENEDDSLMGCIAPCSLVEVDRRFRGTYFLQHSISQYKSVQNLPKTYMSLLINLWVERLQNNCHVNEINLLLCLFTRRAMTVPAAGQQLCHRCHKPREKCNPTLNTGRHRCACRRNWPITDQMFRIRQILHGGGSTNTNNFLTFLVAYPFYQFPFLETAKGHFIISCRVWHTAWIFFLYLRKYRFKNTSQNYA